MALRSSGGMHPFQVCYLVPDQTTRRSVQLVQAADDDVITNSYRRGAESRSRRIATGPICSRTGQRNRRRKPFRTFLEADYPQASPDTDDNADVFPRKYQSAHVSFAGSRVLAPAAERQLARVRELLGDLRELLGSVAGH